MSNVTTFISKMLAAASLVMMTAATASAVTIKKPTAVVELFTSQGCYSCPPADKIVGEFAQKNEVLAISRHVDYWDYLGWKDSFGMKANTERQYAYARALKERQVYTPQAVINGRSHAVGSKKDKILAQISAFENTPQGLTVPVEVAVSNDRVSINVAAHQDAKNATVYIFSMRRKEDVKIPRGENGGKTLTYHNVLQNVQTLGMVKPEGLSAEFPLSELKRNDSDCHAIILQSNDAQGNPGAIVGAIYLTDL